MREPMTLVEQSNAFSRTHRRRFPVELISGSRPVYSSFNRHDEHNSQLKTLSVDVYTSKHLVATGKSIPYPGRQQLDDIILPVIEKDFNREDHRRRRKKKRPSYRKSLYHSTVSSSNPSEITQLTARGVKPESQTVTPIINEDDTSINYQLHYAPPPSPSDDEIEQLLSRLEAVNASRSPSRVSVREKDGYVPFRLPSLYRPTQSRRFLTNSTPKDVRSTLSHYLRKYY